MKLKNILKRKGLLGTIALVLVLGLIGSYFTAKYIVRKRAWSWRQDGIAAAQAGNNDKAVDLLVRYLRRSPYDTEALVWYIKSREVVEMPNGQHLAETIGAIKLLLRELPDRLDEQKHMLELYVKLDRQPEALDTANAIIARLEKKKQNDARTLELKVEVLKRMRQYREALAVADQWAMTAAMDDADAARRANADDRDFEPPKIGPASFQAHMARLALRSLLGDAPRDIIADADKLSETKSVNSLTPGDGRVVASVPAHRYRNGDAVVIDGPAASACFGLFRITKGDKDLDQFSYKPAGKPDPLPKDGITCRRYNQYYELLMGHAYALAADREHGAKSLKLAAEGINPTESAADVLLTQYDQLGLSHESITLLEKWVNPATTQPTTAPAIQPVNLTDADRRQLRYKLARRYWEMAQWQQCVDALNDLDVKDAKTDVTLIAFKAVSLASLKRPAEADPCRAAISSRNLPAARAWAMVLQRGIDAAKVDDRQLVAQCQSALGGDPGNTYLAYYLGEAQSRLGEDELAIEVLRSVVGRNLTWPLPPVRLADLLLRTGQVRHAFEVAVLAAHRHPTNAMVAIALRESGRPALIAGRSAAPMTWRASSRASRRPRKPRRRFPAKRTSCPSTCSSCAEGQQGRCHQGGPRGDGQNARPARSDTAPARGRQPAVRAGAGRGLPEADA